MDLNKVGSGLWFIFNASWLLQLALRLWKACKNRTHQSLIDEVKRRTKINPDIYTLHKIYHLANETLIWILTSSMESITLQMKPSWKRAMKSWSVIESSFKTFTIYHPRKVAGSNLDLLHIWLLIQICMVHQLKWMSGIDNIEIEGKLFTLNQFHWHTSTDHTVDGKW